MATAKRSYAGAFGSLPYIPNKKLRTPIEDNISDLRQQNHDMFLLLQAQDEFMKTKEGSPPQLTPIIEHKKYVKDLEEKYNTLNNELAQLQYKLKSKDLTITSYKNQLEEVRKENTSLQEKYNDINQILVLRQQKSGIYKEQMKQKEEQMKQKEEQMKQKEEQMKQREEQMKQKEDDLNDRQTKFTQQLTKCNQEMIKVGNEIYNFVWHQSSEMGVDNNGIKELKPFQIFATEK